MTPMILEIPRKMAVPTELVAPEVAPEEATFFVVTAALVVVTLVLAVVCVTGALYVVTS